MIVLLSLTLGVGAMGFLSRQRRKTSQNDEAYSKPSLSYLSGKYAT